MRRWAVLRIDRRLSRLKRELDRANYRLVHETEALKTRLDYTRPYGRPESDGLLREAVHHLDIRDAILADLERLLWWRQWLTDEPMSLETILSHAWWRGE